MSNTLPMRGVRPSRHDHLLPEDEHAPYRIRCKPPEPTICPQCSAIFEHGRWAWGTIPDKAHRETCPACYRINDNYPAGFVTLTGPFFQSHREEIMSLLRHEEQRAKLEHPLQRVISREQRKDGVLITTTDIHLAKTFGDAVHRAYKGELSMHYAPNEDHLRVRWKH